MEAILRVLIWPCPITTSIVLSPLSPCEPDTAAMLTDLIRHVTNGYLLIQLLD
jgi:hypothetical protein